MPTLKNLVDEVVNIENEIVECRDTLRQILIDKKIEGLENENRLSALIQKVNEFENIYKLWLYRDGNEHTSLSGGYKQGFTYNGGSTSKKSNSLYMQAPYHSNTGWGTFETINKINLSEFKALKVKYIFTKTTNTSSYFRLGVIGTSNTAPTSNHISKKCDGVLNAYQVTTLDISSVSSGYITVSALQGCEIEVSEIWLEK